MEELFNNSVLETLYENRNEELSHYIIKNNNEYKEKEIAMEKKLKELLNYVSGEHYEALEKEIEDFLFDHVAYISEFWCSKYYKIGFSDGLNVKNELAKEVEEIRNGKFKKSNG